MIQSLQEISAPTRALSLYISEAAGRALPPKVVEKAEHHILDTFAAMISGTRLPPGEAALKFAAVLGTADECSIVGGSRAASMIDAALINGMLAHADETDDSHAPSRNHPGCAVIPAALAAAERADASAEAFLRAVVLGYDVAARVNYALGADAFAAASRSTHSFGGCFGAGAAAGSLLGIDALQARHLLSYCAQQASGVGCNVRDSEHIEKAFDFAGMPARNGATAALMVTHGFTGVDDVFSGERNFFEAFSPTPDPAQLVDGLGERFEILGTNIKKWCVGSPAQAALDAMTQIIEAIDVAAADIDKVTIHLPTRSARTVDGAPMPDVNVQHLLAVLLIDRKLTFDSVHDHARMSDPQVLALRRRMKIEPSEELMHARPRRQAIVDVVTRDGAHLSRRAVAVRGTADNPMSRAEVEDKAHDLIAPVLGSDGSRALIDALRGLANRGRLRQMRALWTPQPGARQRSAS
ncbi:MAG: MmgE/PrpD family protein [Alphaproteobacteria bacterium]